jgi:hypothetical protein
MKRILFAVLTTAGLALSGSAQAKPLMLNGPLFLQFYDVTSAPDQVSRDVLKHWHAKIDQEDDLTLNGTPYAIHTGFAQVIEQNFARLNNADVATLMDRLSDQELTDIAYYYGLSAQDTGHTAQLMNVLAVRVDAARFHA